MHPLAIVAAFMMLAGFVHVRNYERTLAENKSSYETFVSGQLRAYGSYVAAYAAANTTYNGNVTDAMAGVPAWLKRPNGMAGIAQSGRAFVYFMPATNAEGFAYARKCGGSLICGMTQSSQLYRPGKASPASVSLPASIPANGALVLVL